MHNAPSVTYPVGRCHFAACLYAGVWVMAAASCTAWALMSPRLGLWQAVAALLVLVLGAWLATAWWRAPEGDLAWDGASWSWRGAAGRPAVRLDLQRCMLLEWRSGGRGAEWLWLDQQLAGDRWMALRRAVYSPARTEASSEAQAPLAGP